MKRHEEHGCESLTERAILDIESRARNLALEEAAVIADEDRQSVSSCLAEWPSIDARARIAAKIRALKESK